MRRRTMAVACGLAMAVPTVLPNAANAAGATISASRSAGIAGEKVRFTGFIGTKFARKVVLQRHTSAKWVSVKSAKTTTAGRFSILTTVRGATTTYRVRAPKVKYKGKTYTARNTPKSKVRTDAQSATFIDSSPSFVGAAATAIWAFAPARAGRKVDLQRLDGATWTTIASSSEQANGQASVQWTPTAAGQVSLRAVARTGPDGAKQYVSTAQTVTIDDRPPPATFLDLTNWKLTLPIGTAAEPTKAIEVKQTDDPPLAEYQHPEYFHLNTAGNGVVFRAHAGGATTSGSGYPRSELREMNGSSLASWGSDDGKTHIMTVTQAITHQPVVKPDVVAGQIHDASDDIVMVRLEGSKLRVSSPGESKLTLDDNYVLGTAFTLRIEADSGGVRVYYNGVLKATYPKHGSGWYFKAGVYTQSNLAQGDAPDAYGEVVIYSLHVQHD